MPSFPFGELAPDRADLDPGMIDVRNVIPGQSGYEPFRAHAVTTTELDTRPLGAIQARDENGDVFQYAGDTAKLYQNVDGTWTDKSLGGGYATGTGEIWEFVSWKNKILAVNFSDNPQAATFGGLFTNLTTDLKARHIAVIRDFVVMGNTFDATDGEVPSRVRWSAFGDETSWTVSPTTLADYQDLKISKVERIFGGEYGVIFQSDRVWRMSFVGTPTVFQFDEVLPGIGVLAPGAAAQDGEIIYFLSSKGAFALDRGTQATPIGIGRIDEFLRADLDLNYVNRISAVADPNSKRVFFAYAGAGNTGGRPNRILCYARALDRWSIIDQDVELLWAGGGLGVSLDAAASLGDPDDVDDPDGPASYDDPFWIGDASFVAAFNQDYASGSFSGDVLEANLYTKEFTFTDGGRTQLNGFRPIIQGGSFTARVGTRNSQGDSVTYSSVLTPGSEGRCTSRENARYHRFWITVSGEWQHAIGIEIGRNDLRSGGLRG
jgi:hypothetical protein